MDRARDIYQSLRAADADTPVQIAIVGHSQLFQQMTGKHLKNCEFMCIDEFLFTSAKISNFFEGFDDDDQDQRIYVSDQVIPEGQADRTYKYPEDNLVMYQTSFKFSDNLKIKEFLKQIRQYFCVAERKNNSDHYKLFNRKGNEIVI